MTSTLPPLVQAVSGALGSASASTLTYPLDLITTRLQLDLPAKAKRRGGIRGGLRLLASIVYGNPRKRRPGLGWIALYDGLGSDLFATILSNFFYFYFYSFLRSLSAHGPARKRRRLVWFEDLVLGFTAGVASRAVSTPLSIIALRLQAERGEAEDEEADIDADHEHNGLPGKEVVGVVDVAKHIYAERGLKGFWTGFGTSALLSLNPSLTLSFFQLFRNLVIYARMRSHRLQSPPPGHHASVNTNLRPLQAFFVAAFANTIAVSLLYPLILAKKRIQTGAGTAPGDTFLDVLADAYLGRYDPRSRPCRSGATAQRNPASPAPTYADAVKHSDSAQADTRGKDKDGNTDSKTDTAGIEGLYQGLQMQLLKGFFGQGMTFLVKVRIEQLIVAAYLSHRARRI